MYRYCNIECSNQYLTSTKGYITCIISSLCQYTYFCLYNLRVLLLVESKRPTLQYETDQNDCSHRVIFTRNIFVRFTNISPVSCHNTTAGERTGQKVKGHCGGESSTTLPQLINYQTILAARFLEACSPEEWEGPSRLTTVEFALPAGYQPFMDQNLLVCFVFLRFSLA